MASGTKLSLPAARSALLIVTGPVTTTPFNSRLPLLGSDAMRTALKLSFASLSAKGKSAAPRMWDVSSAMVTAFGPVAGAALLPVTVIVRVVVALPFWPSDTV